MSGRLLALLALLYFAQGLPSGLIAKALPALLREQDVSLSLIGFTSALALPWALKFLWAPLVASRGFETWIDRLPWLLAALLCANVVSATQDIATDGYAITQLRLEWRGHAGLCHEFVARPGMRWWLATIARYKFGDSLA